MNSEPFIPINNRPGQIIHCVLGGLCQPEAIQLMIDIEDFFNRITDPDSYSLDEEDRFFDYFGRGLHWRYTILLSLLNCNTESSAKEFAKSDLLSPLKRLRAKVNWKFHQIAFNVFRITSSKRSACGALKWMLRIRILSETICSSLSRLRISGKSEMIWIIEVLSRFWDRSMDLMSRSRTEALRVVATWSEYLEPNVGCHANVISWVRNKWPMD